MSTLYEIQGEYLTLMEYADSVEDTQLFLDTLESIQGELEVKADNYGIVISELKAAVNKYDTEIKRLTAKKEALENNIEIMKQRLKEAIELMEVKDGCLQTEHYKFRICKNGGKLPVHLDLDEKHPELFPEKYQDTKIVLNKDKIREDLEAGIEMSCAHIGERGTHLRIS